MHQSLAQIRSSQIIYDRKNRKNSYPSIVQSIKYGICTIYAITGILHSNEEQNTAAYSNKDESH